MTVVIGLAGLLFTGFGVFTSMALGAILVVLIAVVGSLTVLPAMLALLGDRIDRGRIWPRRRRTRSRRRRGMWQVLAAGVTNRPRTSLALAVVILGALAAPCSRSRPPSPDRTTCRRTLRSASPYTAIERAFPGSEDTADLVVSGHGLHSTAGELGAPQDRPTRVNRSPAAGARWRCRYRATARRRCSRSRCPSRA